jgi:blocked-early-in-transport protein 1
MQYADAVGLQNETFSSFSTTLKGSATRLGRMAQSGNKVAILKLAGIIIVFFVLLYWVWHLIF